jgi:26S proteasome regulatory subunit N2
MKGDEPTAVPNDAIVEGEGKKRKEPSFEVISNFSRVTPAQSAYVAFPSTCRYQPVRPLSTRSTSARTGKPSASKPERFAGGGGIIMLQDQRPDDSTDYVDFFVPPPPTPSVPPVSGNTTAAATTWNRTPHIALDESTGDAEPPQSFEVSWVYHRRDPY